MTTILNTLSDNPGAKKKRRIKGRGIGSGKGKTCGRGGKGQTARTGVAIKGFEGGQMPIHRRLPKRGFNNPFPNVYVTVNTGDIQRLLDNGKLDGKATVNAESLIKAGFLKPANKQVKLLGKGELKAKVNVEVSAASGSALKLVEKAGGKVTVLQKKKNPVDEQKAQKSAEKKAKRAAQKKGGKKAAAAAEAAE
jgi:large subunit ribosomal protein L15